MSVDIPSPATPGLDGLSFLPEYYERLDGGDDIVSYLSPRFSFAFLWADEGGAREFAGGFDEFDGYMAQRAAGGQVHHIDVGATEKGREVALGHTTRDGERLGTFMTSVWLDAEGRAERLFSARTLAFGTADIASAAGSEAARGTYLTEFLDAIDERPQEIIPMLAESFQYAVIWSDDRGVHEFAGSLPDYHEYLDQREADGQLHHVVVPVGSGDLEVSLGYTTRWGDELGTFMMFTQVDRERRLQRLMAARTLSFRPIWS